MTLTFKRLLLILCLYYNLHCLRHIMNWNSDWLFRNCIPNNTCLRTLATILAFSIPFFRVSRFICFGNKQNVIYNVSVRILVGYGYVFQFLSACSSRCHNNMPPILVKKLWNTCMTIGVKMVFRDQKTIYDFLLNLIQDICFRESTFINDRTLLYRVLQNERSWAWTA